MWSQEEDDNEFSCGLAPKLSLARYINQLHWLERMNLLLILPGHGQPTLMERSADADGKNLDCFCPSCICFVNRQLWFLRSLIPHPFHQQYWKSHGAAVRQWLMTRWKQLRLSKTHVGWSDWFPYLSSHILGVWFSAPLKEKSRRRALDSHIGFCVSVCMCMWCSCHMYLTFTYICNRF